MYVYKYIMIWETGWHLSHWLSERLTYHLMGAYLRASLKTPDTILCSVIYGGFQESHVLGWRETPVLLLFFNSWSLFFCVVVFCCRCCQTAGEMLSHVQPLRDKAFVIVVLLYFCVQQKVIVCVLFHFNCFVVQL